MWSNARLTVYVSTFLTGLATLGAFLGYATFDAGTGMVDVAPFNVYLVAPLIAGPISAALAAMALWLGWGGKPQ
jgi:hypothetical protein